MPRVLGDVDDPQLARRRCATVALVEERLPSARQKTRCDLRSRSPTCGAAGDRLVVVQPRGRGIEHSITSLPGTQAVVDVLVAHPVPSSNSPTRSSARARDVHARAGRRKRRAGDLGRPPVGRLEPVAVVEPLGRVRVADRSARTEFGCRDREAWRRRSRRSGPARPRTGGTRASRARATTSELSSNDVALRIGRPQAAVDVGREPAVVLARHDLDPVDLTQDGQVLGAAGVVGDDHASHSPRHGLGDARAQRPHALGIAEARDHDVDRPAALAIPGQRPAVGVVAGARAQPQSVLQRREAQREAEDAKQQGAPAQIAVGQVDPAANAGEPPAHCGGAPRWERSLEASSCIG